jgi:hypothetical protein
MVAVKTRHRDCTHPNTANERDKCRRRNGKYSPSQRARVESYSQDAYSTFPALETMDRVLAWVKRQTKLHREGRVGTLPTTTEVARALFPLGAIARVGKDGIVTSAGVVKGNTYAAKKWLSLLEAEGLVQRHNMTHGFRTMYWSAVDRPTGKPVPRGTMDYYS